jgi:hypothetical protein
MEITVNTKPSTDVIKKNSLASTKLSAPVYKFLEAITLKYLDR